MLDKQSAKLLTYLARIGEDGSFKIIEIADITNAVSKNAAIDAVRPMLKLLHDNEMIDIKYSDESKYSLAVLPKGRVFVESRKSKRTGAALSRRAILFAIVGSFVAAFAGALVGVVVANLLGL